MMDRHWPWLKTVRVALAMIWRVPYHARIIRSQMTDLHQQYHWHLWRLAWVQLLRVMWQVVQLPCSLVTTVVWVAVAVVMSPCTAVDWVDRRLCTTVWRMRREANHLAIKVNDDHRARQAEQEMPHGRE